MPIKRTSSYLLAILTGVNLITHKLEYTREIINGYSNAFDRWRITEAELDKLDASF